MAQAGELTDLSADHVTAGFNAGWIGLRTGVTTGWRWVDGTREDALFDGGPVSGRMCASLVDGGVQAGGCGANFDYLCDVP